MQIQYNDLLKLALTDHFAVPAFNYSDIWDLYALIEVAQEERSPIIISTIPTMRNLIPIKQCCEIAKALTRDASVPVFCHLDHSKSVDLCKEVIDCGYHSVMIDASLQPIDENIKATKEVVKYAHDHEISVEAEIGHVRGRNIETAYDGEDYLTRVEDAVRFVDEANPDALAVGIGNAHGFYVKEPQINFDRLDAIRKAVSIPLVLHGGTGLPEETVTSLIQHGIQKINIGTEIIMSFSNEIYNELQRLNGKASMLTLPEKAMSVVRETARKWIRICNSSNRF